jgi:branched-chain amino acid transport system substrate-binding protein
VQVLVGDDGLDPARHRSLVEEFVERRGVIVFLNNFEIIGGEGSIGYLVEQGIPVVGNPLGDKHFAGRPTYFSQGSDGDRSWDAHVFAAASVALPAQSKLGVITCTEVPGCRNDRRVAESGRDAGFAVVYQSEVSIAQPDYTAECLAARNADVQVLFTILDGLAIRRLAASCARQGFRPRFVLSAKTLDLEGAADPNLDRAIVPSEVFSRALETTPASGAFHAVLRRYLPGTKPWGLHPYGWVAAKLLERGADRLANPPSPRSVLEGLWSIKDDDLGGLTAPLTFDRQRGGTERACWFVDVIRQGRVTPFLDGRRTCR